MNFNILFSLAEIFSTCQHLLINSIDLKELKLTKTQISVLFALIHRDSLSMTQLAQHTAISREQATRAVTPLVDLGYVERFQDPSNRKLVLVHLTDQGEAFLTDETLRIGNKIQASAGSLSPEEEEKLKTSIETILEIMKKLA